VTEPEHLQQVDRTYVLSQGRKLSYFAGCDYFRLGNHPTVLAAFHRGLDRFGGNVAASRMTTGNHALYAELERRLAGFFRAPAAVLVPTGYLSNLVVAQALQGEFARAFVDEAAHPSLLDAARLLKTGVVRFKHRDPEDLALKVRTAGQKGAALVMTDGMFARDGSVAPLRLYKKLLPTGTIILIDDAHGAGVLGSHGRGTPEFEQVSTRNLIQTITLSKGFGAYGGAVLCTSALRKKILGKSRMYIGSTPIPLPLVQAALAALKLLERGGAVRRRLLRKTAHVRRQLSKAGIAVENNPGPIISFVPRNRRQEAALRGELLAAGVYPSFIKYPGTPARGHFRFVVSSEHTIGQLDCLARALCRAGVASA
jgi:7-keto-8-aminopelargonate synthetase-like enzyme